MRTRGSDELCGLPARLIRAGAAAIIALVAAGCASESLSLAPASPQTPYVPETTQAAAPAGEEEGRPDFGLPPDPTLPIAIPRPEIDASRTLGLPDLIDIAQSTNPATSAAWERARQAALAVGMAKAAYLPVITAGVLAGYQRSSEANPSIDLSASGPPGFDVSLGGSQFLPQTFSTTAREIVPAATMNWLLLDFGGRAASVAAAHELSNAANIGFTAAHQKLIYDVASAFYQVTASRAQVAIARDTVVNARFIFDAARARRARGISTEIEVAQARQQAAQAQLELVESEGFASDAYHSLLRAMGVSPTLALKIEDVSGRPLPRAISTDVDRLIAEALRRRPDVQAAFARMKADQHNVERAQSDFLPRVGLTGSANQDIGVVDVNDSLLGLDTRSRVNAPNANLMVGLTVPIFDGGTRDAQLKSAQAQADAAAQEFAQIQTDGARQIVVAYDTLRTSLAAYAAATELTQAATITAKAQRDYYQQGLGTLTDAVAAQTALLQARLARAKAHSDALVAAATIAFATGSLTSGDTLGR
ncbi:MAG: TolC family protein [Roseiarcus sp.]